MPFSTAGMNPRGIEPPKISSTNSNSLPRGSGSILILQSPNWPWPPVCFLWRPCASTRAVMVSRYGMRGGLSSTSTPKRRFSFATVTSMCIWPWPASSSSCVCGSRWYLIVLSSSSRRCIAVLILSSSPRLFGSMAYDSTGSGNGIVGNVIPAALSASVSLVLRVLQFGDGADVAGLELRHVRGRLALQRDQMAEALLRALRRVGHRRVRLQAALVDAEHRDAAGELIGHRLPDERGVWRLLIGRLGHRCRRSPSP